MEKNILLLIKIFNKEEYADAFIEKGELFCRTLGDFKKCDDNDGRRDKFEAVTHCFQPDQVNFVINFKDIDGAKKSLPIEKLDGPIFIQNNCYDRLNLFCMYAVISPFFEETYETEEERIAAIQKINAMLKEVCTLSHEALSLGPFAVVVYQVRDFVDMVLKEARNRNWICSNQLVDYYDPDTFNGSFNPVETIFKKRYIYQHQNEYRFAFDSLEQEGVKTIHLGSLSDIAFKLPSKEISERVQLKLAE